MNSLAPAIATPARQSAILIVDDAPANIGLLRSIMDKQGHRTFVANSSRRALEIAQRVQPDLVLLDVMMPDMDGFEACRQLKSNPLTAHIPVIFVSARTEADDVVAGFDIGAADYIFKPLRAAEVCARVRAQLQLRTSAERQKEQADRLLLIVDSIDEGLMIVDAGGALRYANPACARYLDYAPGELTGRKLGDLLPAAVTRDCLDYFAEWTSARDTAPPRNVREIMVRPRVGAPRAMDLTITPMFAGEALFVALLHDITHHKQSETALQRAALLDSLTKIANRRHFDGFLEKEWQRAIRSGQSLSLIVLDVDHFKLYNDTLGHAAGDTCLRKVATALQSHAPRATDLAARYGGEEFVLLFAETNAEHAAALAERIRANIEALRVPNPRSPTSEWLTVSIGVATIVPTQLDHIEDFFVAADRMMYAAKAAGRNRVAAVHAGAGREAAALN